MSNSSALTSAALAPGATDTDRIRAAVLVLATDDPDRGDVKPDHVVAVGRRAVMGGVVALGAQGGGTVADRLWGALGAPAPTDAGLAALNAALVLLMDHELAASTMAARVAAGTGADPWLVLLTGLAALGGRGTVAAASPPRRCSTPCGARGGGPRPVCDGGRRRRDPRVRAQGLRRRRPARRGPARPCGAAGSRRLAGGRVAAAGRQRAVRAQPQRRPRAGRPGPGVRLPAGQWRDGARAEPDRRLARPRDGGVPPGPAVPAPRGLHWRGLRKVTGTPGAGPAAEEADPHTGHWAG